MDFIENGRPAYHPSDLLKLFIYGYLNKVRSSRDLEKECKRNLEVMWLLMCLRPDHNTIANFRRDNPKAIKKVFRTTTCPQGEVLRTNGTWYKECNRRDNVIIFKQYKIRSCKLCPVRSQCTRSKNGRLLSRSTYAEYYENNRKVYQEKEHLYKRRQVIVEHPFGTIKRQWGFSYILTKK